MGTVANSEDPDEIMHKAAFHQCLQYLLRQSQSSEKEIYSYTCVKQPLKKRQNKALNDEW